MSNTGYLGYRTLVQVDLNTGLPTGLTKLNLPTDPDYIPPVLNEAACPLPTDPQCDATNPIFFTEVDEVVTIAWTEDRQTRYGAGVFQAWVLNTETNQYEKSYPPMRADLKFPSTTEYYYDNSGGVGYIIMGRAETCPNVVTEPPPEEPPVLMAGQSLPDGFVGEPYFATIYFDGSLPLTGVTEDTPLPSWATYTIVGNSVKITGIPDVIISGQAFAFTVSNAFGSDSFSDEIDITNVIPPPPPGDTIFGFIIGTNDSVTTKIKVVQQLGSRYIRGAHTGLANYQSGQRNGFYDQCKAEGMFMIHTFNWNQSSSPTGKFASNEALYKSKLNWALDDFGADTSVVKLRVCENEPANLRYYGDTMANYIRQLGWFIEVCMARGLSCTDGCTHIPAIIAVSNGGGGLVAQIINGINDLRIAGKPLTYVNMHTNLDPRSGAATARKFIEAASFLRTATGIPDVISNEWHTETTNETVMQQAIDDCITAGLKYSIIYGGDCPQGAFKATPLNCGLTLTEFGKFVKGAIVPVLP